MRGRSLSLHNHQVLEQKKILGRLRCLEFILSDGVFYSGHSVHKYSYLLDSEVIEEHASSLQAVCVLQRPRRIMQLAPAQKQLPQVSD